MHWEPSVPGADLAESVSPITLGFDHVSLRVPDYEASLAWYRDLLELPVLREWTDPELPGLRLCHLQLGAVKLELIGDGDTHPRVEVNSVDEHMRPEGVIHLCLTVPDLDAATERLRAKGVLPMAGPLYVEPLDITLIVVKDNSGNVLEISQSGRTTASPQEDAEIASGDVEHSLDALVRRALGLIRPGRRVILGITGSPGAGKTTLATTLVERINATGGESASPLAVHLPMDGFHLANASLDRLGNHDRKGALDTFDGWGFVGLLRRVLAEIDHPVYAPSFERTVDEPIAGEHEVPAGVPLVIVEGNYLLVDAAPWHQVKSLLAEAWFCVTSHTERVTRLVDRHTFFGRDVAAATAWAHNVDGVNAAVIEQTRPRADLLVSGEYLPHH
jgi:pantothenate kinase/catechol 2,3-dioxygenase-like lactoylglutathione lyase family enzyme